MLDSTNHDRTVRAVPTARTVRDLTVLPVAADRVLVVACDSIGGIGDKPHDAYPADPATCGHFALRVPLLELLAAGARPALAVDTLSVEREPTGDAIIAAMRELLADVGLTDPATLTGSTEENVSVVQTGIGVTVIGFAHPDELRAGRARAGDSAILVGLPLSAPTHRLYPGHPGQVSVAEVAAVARLSGVHDMLPVGSRGVAAEAHDLAASAGLAATLDPGTPVDLHHSGGPASCVLLAGPDALVAPLRALRDDLPVHVIGRFTGPPPESVRRDAGAMPDDPRTEQA